MNTKKKQKREITAKHAAKTSFETAPPLIQAATLMQMTTVSYKPKKNNILIFVVQVEKDSTFGNGVALVEGVEGGGEGLESGELDDLAEAGEVEDGFADGVGVLADLVEAVGEEEGVAGGRLEEKVERHGSSEVEVDGEEGGRRGGAARVLEGTPWPCRRLVGFKAFQLEEANGDCGWAQRHKAHLHDLRMSLSQ